MKHSCKAPLGSSQWAQVLYIMKKTSRLSAVLKSGRVWKVLHELHTNQCDLETSYSSYKCVESVKKTITFTGIQIINVGSHQKAA